MLFITIKLMKIKWKVLSTFSENSAKLAWFESSLASKQYLFAEIVLARVFIFQDLITLILFAVVNYCSILIILTGEKNTFLISYFKVFNHLYSSLCFFKKN